MSTDRPNTGSEPTAGRALALRVVRRVTDGAYADKAFAGEAARARLSPRDRAFAQHLAYGTVQRQRTLDRVIQEALDRPSDLERGVRDVLRLGIYELAFTDGAPVRAVVDEAVRQARSLPGDAKRRNARAGLVNAVLRRLSDDAASLVSGLDDSTAADAAIAHSVPDWISQALFDALGPEDARAVLAASNLPAESAIRWNPLRGPRATLERELPQGWSRDPVLSEAYVLTGGWALEDSEAWSGGRAMGQSRASLLPSLVLDPQPRERILDLCAAPGAKATHMAALSRNGAEITAVELHPARARALEALARRMGARLRVVEGDARTVALDGQFDGILVDAPCTGLGVLSSKPDARWKRREESLAPLVELQGEILARALSLARPGGRVVYSTCTLTTAENEDLVAASGARLIDLSPQLPSFAHPTLPGALRSLPHRTGSDGFFVASLEGGG